MTQEEKELLIKDLCGRLPYGVKVLSIKDFDHDWYNLENVDIKDNKIYVTTYESYENKYIKIEDAMPYLFPLSSMTDEQENEWTDLRLNPLGAILEGKFNGKEEHMQLLSKSLSDPIQWCYENHFDVHGLIPMGLALKASDGMYNQNI